MTDVSLDFVVQVIIDRVVQNVLKTYTFNFSNFQRDERDESEFSKSSKSNNDNIDDDFVNRWNTSNFDFFDFLYESKFVVFEAFFLKHNDKNFYFKNVHVFVDRAKKLAVIKKDKMI